MPSYAYIRPQMKTGDLLFWRNHKGGPTIGYLERFIVQAGTMSPYIHVGMCWVEGGRVWVMEITTRGCAPRLLSMTGDFAWIAAPQALSKEALWRAQSFFGEWTYSRWQAFTGWLGRLSIGKDLQGQCAEYVLTVLNDCEHLKFTNPTATPQGVADAALMQWQTPLLHVSNPKRDSIYPPDMG